MALLKRKRSGLSDPMSVVTRFVNACNRHDADSVAACLHPEFDSIQPMYPSRNFRGADQVRRNWQAIFDAEPGFRLTVLRQAASDDTVWLELHGAGRDAEVAGVFVMGTQGDRIRWARIYSALIEPLPEGAVDPVASSPATLRQVPPLEDSPDGAATEPAAAGAGGVVDEDLIAPVVDIDGGGRSRRRRSSRRRSHETPEPEAPSPAAEDVPPAVDDVVPAAEDDVAPAADDDVVPAADDDVPPAAEDGAPAADDDMAPAAEDLVTLAEEAPAPATTEEPAAVDWAPPAAEPEPDAEVDSEPAVVADEVDPVAAIEQQELAEPAPEVVAAAELLEEREPEVVAEPAVSADPVVSEPVTRETGPDDIVWADLTPESPAGAEPEPEPTTSIEVPVDQGRPGKWRARKKR